MGVRDMRSSSSRRTSFTKFFKGYDLVACDAETQPLRPWPDLYQWQRDLHRRRD